MSSKCQPRVQHTTQNTASTPWYRVLRVRNDKFNACDRIIRSFKMIRSESGSSYDTHDFETDENQRIEPVQEKHDSEIDAV